MSNSEVNGIFNFFIPGYRNVFYTKEKSTCHQTMVNFSCDRCGKCCVSLGQSVIIERQLNDRDYYCRSKIDNAVFPVQVDTAFQEEIAEEYLAGETARSGPEKKPCVFLRQDPAGGGACCAIYATRPAVCRNFQCYHTLIINRDGEVCGRVIGKNTLRTDDPVLQNLWDNLVAPAPCSDAAGWTGWVREILAGSGYRAEMVE
jgi:Fe-S-cluster containining protein